MKTHLFSFLLAVFVLFLISSCSTDEDGSMESSLCNPTADYYFTGILGNSLECWNVGTYNYQVYHGGGSASYSMGDTSYHWTLGLDQYPVPDVNKTLFIYYEVPYDYTDCSKEQFLNTFQAGPYAFHPIKEPDKEGIELRYSQGGTFYSSAFGSQEDSYINCLEVSQATNTANSATQNVAWEFRCNLYDPNGTFFKKVEIGRLRVDALWFDY